MAMCRIDDDDIGAGIDQHLGALETLVAGAGRSGDAQALMFVLRGIGVIGRLFHVVDGDETDAADIDRRRR